MLRNSNRRTDSKKWKDPYSNSTDTMENTGDLSLQQLLHLCTGPKSQQWERGWHIFLQRYKIFLYHAVSRRCMSWRAPRLQKQRSQVVNDILDEVLYLLCDQEKGVLRSFQHTDSEHCFRAWLTLISDRAAMKYLHKNFTDYLLETDAHELLQLLKSCDPICRLEWYEHLVAILRKAQVTQRGNFHRDTHLFLLYVWSDLPPKLILSLPQFRNLSNQVFDNVIYRMRELLQKKRSHHFD